MNYHPGDNNPEIGENIHIPEITVTESTPEHRQQIAVEITSTSPRYINDVEDPLQYIEVPQALHHRRGQRPL